MRINKFTYFYPEKPKLITKEQSLFLKLSNNPNWIGEYKYNGCRLQLHNINNGFGFWDRYNKKLSYRPTDEVLDTLSLLKLPKGYNLFDGELRHNKVIGVKHKIILYDVFVWDGEVLLDKTFEERRSILELYFKIRTDPVGITEQFKDNFRMIYDNVLDDPEIEGLVLKNKKGMLDLSRSSGRDSVWMMKVRKETGRHRF